MPGYKARRELVQPEINDKAGNFGPYWHYSLYENDSLSGELFYKNMVSFLNFDGKTFTIPNHQPYFGRRHFTLFDPENTRAGIFSFSSWKRLFNNQIGFLETSGGTQVCIKHPVRTIESKFFKLTDKKHREFRFVTTSGNIHYYTTYDDYTSGPRNAISNVSMEIEAPANDMLLILAGLYIIEHFLQG